MVIKWLALIALCIFCVIVGFVLGFEAGAAFKSKGGEIDEEWIQH